MTLDRDELKALIHEVIEERDAERMAHPERRERVTKFVSGGETLMSVTQTRRDWIKTLAAVIGATSILVGGFNAVVVYPMIDQRAHSAIDVHAAEAKATMNEIAKRFVFREEWDKWTAEKEERWRNQAIVNQEMREALVEINKDIKELLRRVR